MVCARDEVERGDCMDGEEFSKISGSDYCSVFRLVNMFGIFGQ